METHFKDIDTNEISKRIAEVVLKTLKSGNATNDDIFQAVKTEFNDDEKSYLTTAFILHRLKIINDENKNK